ncbi:MAG: tetratricopeptide repeat protein [Bacteroidales bacterium]|nr:tetratricopeptide repeat protein [Bacteroidales bacterium]MDD4217444.1 tetratricopeptide repeat protein [Bacteroidales bacterium]MDY0141943.1 tetratricopeptide repeat protein [Bacteroidales bacterium]
MRLNKTKIKRVIVSALSVCLTTIVLSFGTSCSMLKGKSAKEKEDPRIKVFNFNYYFLEANKQKVLGNFEEALRNYTAAMKVDDTQSAVYYEIAGILNIAGDYAGAVDYAEKAVSFDNTNNEYYKLLLAYLYQNNNSADKAANVYKELIKLFPKKINYYFELSNIFMSLGDTKSALKILDDAEKHFGINEIISLEKEATYNNIGNFDLAIAEMQKLVNKFPNNTKYKTLLAESYVNSGKYDQAKAVYASIDEDQITEGIIYFSMADFYRTQKDFENTFKYLAIGIARDDVKLDIKVRIMLQMLDVMGKDNYIIGNIKYLIEVMTEKYPDELKVRALSSDYYIMTENYVAAQKEFDVILAKDKSKFQIWEQALQLDFVLRDMDKLYERSKEAISLYPNVIELYKYYVPAAYFTENYSDVDEAVSYASQFLSNDQMVLLEFLTMQGDALHKISKHHESDSIYELVLYKDAENITVLNNYSYFLAERDQKLDRALELSSKLIELLDVDNAIYFDTHAWVLFKNKQYDEALIFINKAINVDVKNPVYLEHQGDILFELGKIDKAVKSWESSVEYGNDSSIIKDKIKNKSIDK